MDAFNRIGYTGVYLHEVNAIFAGMMITQIFSVSYLYLIKRCLYFMWSHAERL